VLLSVVCAGLGICRGILDGRSIGEILPYYIVSFFGLYLYFSVSAIVDLRMQKRILKTNLVDYLENHLAARIGVTDRDLEMLYGSEGAPRRSGRRAIEVMSFPTGRVRELPNKPQEPEPLRAAAGGEALGAEPCSRVQVTDEELEALLKEFLPS